MGADLTASTGTVLVLSAVGLVLQVPTLSFYIARANIPVAILSAWLAILCLSNVVAVGAWGDDEIFAWWNGKVYCDIMVRLVAAGSSGMLCAATALARKLAIIMSNKGPGLGINSWRARAVDLAICLVCPVLIMALLYLVLPIRYGISQNMGCRVPMTKSVSTIVVILPWGLLFSLVAAAYVCVAAGRFWVKRRDARDILHCSNSGMTLRRFVRFLAFCAIVVGIQLPLAVFGLVQNVLALESLGWTSQAAILKSSSKGAIARVAGSKPDPFQISWMVLAIVMFICFGTGEEQAAWWRSIFAHAAFWRIRRRPEDPFTPVRATHDDLEKAFGTPKAATVRTLAVAPSITSSTDHDEAFDHFLAEINMSMTRTAAREQSHLASPLRPPPRAVLPSDGQF